MKLNLRHLLVFGGSAVIVGIDGRAVGSVGETWPWVPIAKNPTNTMQAAAKNASFAIIAVLSQNYFERQE